MVEKERWRVKKGRGMPGQKNPLGTLSDCDQEKFSGSTAPIFAFSPRTGTLQSLFCHCLSYFSSLVWCISQLNPLLIYTVLHFSSIFYKYCQIQLKYTKPNNLQTDWDPGAHTDNIFLKHIRATHTGLGHLCGCESRATPSMAIQPHDHTQLSERRQASRLGEGTSQRSFTHNPWSVQQLMHWVDSYNGLLPNAQGSRAHLYLLIFQTWEQKLLVAISHIKLWL